MVREAIFMKVFLTGSTGLLGNNIVTVLQERGYYTKALVRSRVKEQRLSGKGIEVIKGDLRDVKGFANKLEGCDVLIHAGAYFTEFFQSGNKDNSLYEINVKATEMLFQEAYKRGVKNFIYVSSTGVLETSAKCITTENTGYAVTDNPYFHSKIEAEKKVKAFIKDHPDARVITILPAIMMGPYDHAPTRMGAFVKNFLNNKLPMILPVNMVIVDARDVAEAIVSAIQKGNGGERYIVGGKVHSMKQICEALSDASGKPMPTRKPPFPVVYMLASILAVISKFTGKASPLPRRDELVKMKDQKGYSSEKAKNELGISFRPLSKTIGDTVAWFKNH